MDERQVTAIPGRVERGRRFCDVLAHGRGVADVAVTLAELVVRQADAAGVVRQFGLFQRAAVQRDRARLIAAHVRQPAVQPPQGRQAARRHGFAKRVGRAAEGGGGLIEIVLQEPGFGEHRPQRQLVVARQGGGFEDRGQHLRSLGATAAIERGAGAREHGLRQRRRHAGSIRQTRCVQGPPNRATRAASALWSATSWVRTQSSAASASASVSLGTATAKGAGPSGSSTLT